MHQLNRCMGIRLKLHIDSSQAEQGKQRHREEQNSADIILETHLEDKT